MVRFSNDDKIAPICVLHYIQVEIRRQNETHIFLLKHTRAHFETFKRTYNCYRLNESSC